jgi:ParB-like chromosome segregation protein Spo0J
MPKTLGGKLETKQMSLCDIEPVNNGTKNTISIAENIIITEHLDKIISIIKECDEESKIKYLNFIRESLHNVSPFKDNPVDFVKWIKNDKVISNDYNPNSVAPPEMELLRHSIASDGYTQPIVSWPQDDHVEVIDGFHRHRVGKECKDVREKVMGYLPTVAIKESQEGRNDRIASTIRHNRARGKHQVESMAEIVIELKRRNWSDKRIGKELGMDQDEVLRLTQITGLADIFSETDFTEAWEHSGQDNEQELERLKEFREIEELDLDWAEIMSKDSFEKGWDDKTEKTSVFYGDSNQILGLIKKSQFNDTWFWYAYLKPTESGNVSTKDDAAKEVELRFGG